MGQTSSMTDNMEELLNSPREETISSEDESHVEDRTFQNILSILVGRGSDTGLSNTMRRRQRQEDSNSDSDREYEDQSWGYHHRAVPPSPTHPDTTTISTSEITNLTNISVNNLGSNKVRSIPCMLAGRSMGQKFSIKDKARIGGQFIPSNPRKVAKYKNKVFCGSYAREGDIFMTACQDQKLRIYDSSRGNFSLKQTIQARDVGWSVLDVSVSPDGCHVVYTSWSDSLHQVSLLEPDPTHHTLPLNPDDRQFCIFSVKFSEDSQELLGGANDGYIYLYDRFSNRQSLRVRAHEDDVNAVCFVDETTHILSSGGDDGLVKVWDRRSLHEDDPRPVGVLAGHNDGVTYIDPRGDGRHLISNSKDQSIKLWDIRMFSNEKTIQQSKKVVSNQHWDYRWQRVPRSVGKRHPTLDGDSSVMTYRGHSVLQTLIRCHFSPQFTTGQRYIYTGCAAGRVVVYDLLTGDVVKVLSGHKSCVRDVSWHPYCMELCSSSWDFTVNRWEGVDTGDDEEDIEEEKDENQKKGIRKKTRMDHLL